MYIRMYIHIYIYLKIQDIEFILLTLQYQYLCVPSYTKKTELSKLLRHLLDSRLERIAYPNWLYSDIWVFPKIGVPPKHPKMIIFSRKTHGCWVPPFMEASIYVVLNPKHLRICSSLYATPPKVCGHLWDSPTTKS